MSMKRSDSPRPAFPFKSPYEIDLFKGYFPYFVPPEDPNSLVQHYLSQRQYQNHEDARHVATFLAVGRFSLLLKEALDDILELIDPSDIEQLLVIFGMDFHLPGRRARLHASLASEYGWSCYEEIPLGMRPLFDKLQSLTTVQNFALMDLLERIVHVHMANNDCIASAAATAGLVSGDKDEAH